MRTESEYQLYQLVEQMKKEGISLTDILDTVNYVFTDFKEAGL